jgi:hypothetical protein
MDIDPQHWSTNDSSQAVTGTTHTPTIHKQAQCSQSSFVTTEAETLVWYARDDVAPPHPQAQKRKCPDEWTTRVNLDEEDWSIHKPIISQLYIKEEMKLKDVMLILEAKFGFKAT